MKYGREAMAVAAGGVLVQNRSRRGRKIEVAPNGDYSLGAALFEFARSNATLRRCTHAMHNSTVSVHLRDTFARRVQDLTK